MRDILCTEIGAALTCQVHGNDIAAALVGSEYHNCDDVGDTEKMFSILRVDTSSREISLRYRET